MLIHQNPVTYSGLSALFAATVVRPGWVVVGFFRYPPGKDMRAEWLWGDDWSHRRLRRDYDDGLIEIAQMRFTDEWHAQLVHVIRKPRPRVHRAFVETPKWLR
jgi:hypothetical protein